MDDLQLLRKSPDGFYVYHPAPIVGGRPSGPRTIFENGLFMGTGGALAQRALNGLAFGTVDPNDLLAIWSTP